MFFYRIAAVLTLGSQFQLRSFEAFACDPGSADITLEATNDTPQPGKDQRSGSIVHRPQPDGWFFHSVFSDNTGLFISSDYSRLRLKGIRGRKVSGMNEWFVRIALECWLARHGYVSLHAAAVELNGRALAFTGPSGMGKSTRAEMMIQALGAKLINGDRPLIGVKDQILFGVPWDGKEQCFRNVSYPLQAVCEVRRSKSAYTRNLSFQQRRKLLMRQCFMPMWDTETVLLQMANISRIAKSFPIFRIFCGPEEKDVRKLYELLQKQAFLQEEPEIEAKKCFCLSQTANGYILTAADESFESPQDKAVLLDEVSARIWETLQVPVSREDLLIAIQDQFDTDKTIASTDLDMFLQTLLSKGMIEST